MEGCSDHLCCHLQVREAIGIQLVFLYIENHCEEDMRQRGKEEGLGLAADFRVLPGSYQNLFDIAHEHCQWHIKKYILNVRLIDIIAAEEQLFLTVGLRDLSR